MRFETPFRTRVFDAGQRVARSSLHTGGTVQRRFSCPSRPTHSSPGSRPWEGATSPAWAARTPPSAKWCSASPRAACACRKVLPPLRRRTASMSRRTASKPRSRNGCKRSSAAPPRCMKPAKRRGACFSTASSRRRSRRRFATPTRSSRGGAARRRRASPFARAPRPRTCPRRASPGSRRPSSTSAASASCSMPVGAATRLSSPTAPSRTARRRALTIWRSRSRSACSAWCARTCPDRG